jgi:hypothetical protein
MECLLKPLSLCLLLLLQQRYVYAVLSLGEVNVMILTLYYSSAVYGECHYTLWICTC